MDNEDDADARLGHEDFRSRRHYLPEEAFALVTGHYGPPTDPLPEKQWHGLIDLPTDVLLRTTDNQGSALAQMHDLWSGWIMGLATEPERAPYMFEAAWDAAEDFNATVFVAIHGYYRQAMASLRGAIEVLAVAANFAVQQDTQGLQAWLSGNKEAPRPSQVRKLLAPALGPDASAVLKKLYGELSGYIHTQRDTTNGVLWAGSNGPVWEPESFGLVYHRYRDVMALCFVLLALGWPEFTIPQQLWPLFETPDGAWTSVDLASVRAKFSS